MYAKNKIKFIDISKEKENFYCSLCEYPFYSFFDFEKSKEFNTCHDCYLKFIEGNKKNWSSGARPSKSEIKEYINLRKQLIKRINIK